MLIRLLKFLCILLLPFLGFAWQPDWMIQTVNTPVTVTDNGQDIILSNGLLRRSFRKAANLVCYDYFNSRTQQQLIRAVSPEARISMNGKEYNIGGVHGQSEKAYLLPEWIKQFTKRDNDFYFFRWDTAAAKPFINSPNNRWNSNTLIPKGTRLQLFFRSDLPALHGITVKICYDLFSGIPLLCKWVEIENNTSGKIQIGKLVSEILAVPEEESAVVGKPEQMKTQQGIYIETNYAFNNAMRYSISDQTTHWKTDSTYTSQVNYNFQTPCVLEIYPDKMGGIELAPQKVFQSVRSYELLMDSYDRERRGLAIRKMYRTIAPWTGQNPIFMHLVSKNDQEVRNAIDQCAATGYEAVILSFGSHLNMEDSSAANISRWKSLADYAHSKKIAIGGYSLFSSRKISDTDDVISPLTGKPGGAFFGNAPCFGSTWGLTYRDKIQQFFAATGFDIWENDGPYPGDQCASTTHPGHTGLDDSQWKQMEIQKGLYRWLNEHGVYINAPDWYFLDGTHKIAIGYREVNFSLSRDQQKILNRQNIYDGTWEKTPSMGWGFVPLTKYQGGGPEAVLEPLSEHINDYKQLMMQYYGAGVQACYRGPRLYDTPETQAMVSGVIEWYKQHREVLNSDIIHLRRADGRDWDGWLHVNPAGKEKGFIMVFNPLTVPVSRQIKLPLYYAGIKNTAALQWDDTSKTSISCNQQQEAVVQVTIPAGGYRWAIIK
jgi:hypothetical protein